MATITASLFVAPNGVVDPGVGTWHVPYFNDEMGDAVNHTHDADVMLSGRVLGQLRRRLARTHGSAICAESGSSCSRRVHPLDTSR
jgi:hypothetical protein